MYEKTIFSLFDGAKVRTKYHLCKFVQQIAGFLQRIENTGFHEIELEKS